MLLAPCNALPDYAYFMARGQALLHQKASQTKNESAEREKRSALQGLT
jgi:hypothetical protein